MDPFELRYNCLLLAEKYLGDTTEEKMFKLAKQFADFVAGNFNKLPALRTKNGSGRDGTEDETPTSDALLRFGEAMDRQSSTIEVPSPVPESDLDYFQNKLMTSALPAEYAESLSPGEVEALTEAPEEAASEPATDEAAQAIKSLSEKERIKLYEKTKNPAFFPTDRKLYSNLSPQQYITNYVSLRAPGSPTGVQRFDLFEYQRVLISLFSNPFVLVNTARDMGMTSLATAYALWYAMSQPNVHVVHAGHNFTLAIDIFDRTCFMFDGIASSERTPITKRDDNEKTITFANGSTIAVQAVNEHLWNEKFDLLVLHDLAYVSHSVSTALFDKLDNKRIESITKHKNHVIAYSVPSNLGGFFHRAWTEEKSPWTKLELMYTRHPGRNDDWAQKKREEMGEVAFRKEYMCEFEPVPDVYKLITDPEVKDILRLSGQIPSTKVSKLKK